MVLKNSISRIGIKEISTSIAVSIIYAGLSSILDPDVGYFFKNNPFSAGIPAIFLLAIVGILYGPIIGGLSAGFGNLFFDLLKGPILQGQPLNVGNLVGFVAFLVGGFIVGVISTPSKDAEDLFNFSSDKNIPLKDLFQGSYWIRLIRNIIASVIGLSLVSGFVIAYGMRIKRGFNYSTSFPTFTSISYQNAEILLLTVPIILILISIVDFNSDKKTGERINKRRNLSFLQMDDNFELSGTIPDGNELWQGRWGAIKINIKNKSNNVAKYDIRVSSDDIFTPHKHITPLLKPNEEHQMYFDVFGVDDGERTPQIHVNSSENNETVSSTFYYFVEPTATLIIQKLVSIFLIIGLIASILAISRNIVQNAKLDTLTLISLIVVPIEIFIVMFIYWIWPKIKFERELKEGIDPYQQNFDALTQEQRKSYQSSIKYNSRVARILYSISGIFVIAIYAIIIYIQGFNHQINWGDKFFWLIGVLLIFVISGLYFFEKANEKQNQMEKIDELNEKVVRSIQSKKTPIKFKTSRIVINIKNIYDNPGLRLYIHGIDHFYPEKLELDLKPGENTYITLDYTPLDDGKRSISIEIVEFKDKNGTIIPPEEAKTLDQETVDFKVTTATTLGLSPKQISLLKKVIAGVGAASVALGTLADIFQIKLDPQTLNATIPLIVLLQSPVIWLLLYFQNKSAKTYEAEE